MILEVFQPQQTALLLAIKLAGAKLPIKTKFVARSDMELGA